MSQKENGNIKTPVRKHNIGRADRTIRGLAGVSMTFVGLFVLDGFSLNPVGLVVMALSLYPMITSQMAVCPVYKLLGVSTRTAEDIEREAEYEENYEQDFR